MASKANIRHHLPRATANTLPRVNRNTLPPRDSIPLRARDNTPLKVNLNTHLKVSLSTLHRARPTDNHPQANTHLQPATPQTPNTAATLLLRGRHPSRATKLHMDSPLKRPTERPLASTEHHPALLQASMASPRRSSTALLRPRPRTLLPEPSFPRPLLAPATDPHRS
jgi:hypothetical protein